MEYYNLTGGNITNILTETNYITGGFAIPLLLILVPATIIILYLNQRTGELFNSILVAGLYSIISTTTLIMLGLISQNYFSIVVVIIAIVGFFKYLSGNNGGQN